VAAESVGIPFVHVAAATGTESVIAAIVVAATSTVRVIVGINLGDEHPVTLAEEIVVLDNLSNGRIGVIGELGSLDTDAAAEDVAVLRASWGGRPICHRGTRWQVPARLAGHVAPEEVMVTPPPAQLTVPLWIAGHAAPAVGAALGVCVVAADCAAVDAAASMAPGRTTLGGDTVIDRHNVLNWSSAGATHLLCALDGAASVEAIARSLAPEVAMVEFPRVVTETPPPARWPRSADGVPDRRPDPRRVDRDTDCSCVRNDGTLE
jgi:alkanesulfonate monooxygenase SsuD/methylene tetrahydromethanopterin reductase-like flavin-dependent oxidoreductase (luciferase family)